jgi:transcriptional regulator of acetoin/glycerol metabolism
MNVLERLLVLHPGGLLDAPDLDEVLECEFSPGSRATGERPPPDARVPESEIIASVLEATGGNVSRAARRLELARSTLRHKIKKYDLGDLIPSD